MEDKRKPSKLSGIIATFNRDCEWRMPFDGSSDYETMARQLLEVPAVLKGVIQG